MSGVTHATIAVAVLLGEQESTEQVNCIVSSMHQGRSAIPQLLTYRCGAANRRFGPESDLSRCSKTMIVGFLPGFHSTKSGLLAACSAGYAALFAAATLAPTTRALNSSTVITSAVEKASIVNVARWTSAADSAP
jgi:hypothetical protein